mmetsp:Transcript_5050/g.18184  ORF Transcript_5050/g.18184 Transcript_5050/m.18184 type:complete len:350 (+) Transcript_5050:2004-3053(+)
MQPSAPSSHPGPRPRSPTSECERRYQSCAVIRHRPRRRCRAGVGGRRRDPRLRLRVARGAVHDIGADGVFGAGAHLLPLVQDAVLEHQHPAGRRHDADGVAVVALVAQRAEEAGAAAVLDVVEVQLDGDRRRVALPPAQPRHAAAHERAVIVWRELLARVVPQDAQALVEVERAHEPPAGAAARVAVAPRRRQVRAQALEQQVRQIGVVDHAPRVVAHVVHALLPPAADVDQRVLKAESLAERDDVGALSCAKHAVQHERQLLRGRRRRRHRCPRHGGARRGQGSRFTRVLEPREVLGARREVIFVVRRDCLSWTSPQNAPRRRHRTSPRPARRRRRPRRRRRRGRSHC